MASGPPPRKPAQARTLVARAGWVSLGGGLVLSLVAALVSSPLPLVLIPPFAVGAVLGATAGGRAATWCIASLVAILCALVAVEHTLTRRDYRPFLVLSFAAIVGPFAPPLAVGIAAGASATRSLREQSRQTASERDARP